MTRAPAEGSRLSLLFTSWQDFGTGSVQCVEYLACGFADRGHHVVVATPEDGLLGRHLERRGVPVEDVRFSWGWNPRDGRRLARIARRHDVDLVDAQESKDRKAAILARWLYRGAFALIITRRQLTSTFFLENRLYAAAADRIVAVSRAVADSLASSGVPQEDIEVVYEGLDPVRVEGDVSAEELSRLRDELELDAALPTVGMVGRRKQQEELLAAASVLGRPVNVLLVGIERDESLAREERRLPPGCHVACTGFVEDVRPYLDLLDVKVLATHREGLSQALLEAMGRGVPVITAAAGGTVELVEDGVNGLRYPPGDAEALAAQIERLLTSPRLREELRANAGESVRREFSIERYVRRTEALYRKVLAERTDRGVA